MKNRKNLIATAVAVCVILTLIAFSIAAGADFSGEQAATLRILLIVCGCSVAWCFVAGEITHNYSQMDKLWSILPVAYVWIIAARGGMSARLILYAVIVTAWGSRLTYNFALKGAYSIRFWEGKEDYRWSIVRRSPVFMRGFAWTLFDLFFISLYQNLLVLAITLPALACSGSGAPLGAVDIAGAIFALAFLALETAADLYQWRFHKTKKKMLDEGKPLSALPMPYCLGFNTTGPWGYMRHPNYLGEQGFWLSLYFFVPGAGAASNGIFNITLVGPLLLVLLFMGSSALGEKISSGKYPEYSRYVGQVFKYLPLRKLRTEAGLENDEAEPESV